MTERILVEPRFRRIPGGFRGELEGKCPLCGYEGELRNQGSLGYHCYWCGAKVLCADNKYV